MQSIFPSADMSVLAITAILQNNTLSPPKIWYSQSIQSVIIKFAYQIRNIWAATRSNEPCIVYIQIAFQYLSMLIANHKVHNALAVPYIWYEYILAMWIYSILNYLLLEITHELVRPDICAQITVLIKISTPLLCRKCLILRNSDLMLL